VQSQHAGVNVSDHNGLSTTGVPIPAADAFAAAPGGDLSSNTDLLGQPYNARNNHGLGTTIRPSASVPALHMLGDAQDHAPPSVSDLQGRVQRVEELAIQANASPSAAASPPTRPASAKHQANTSTGSKRFDPLHTTLEQIATRLQRLEQNGSSKSRTSTSVSSKNGSPADASKTSLTAPTTMPDLRSDAERPKFWGNSHYRHFLDQASSCLSSLLHSPADRLLQSDSLSLAA
jgi:hypothetical protein